MTPIGGGASFHASFRAPLAWTGGATSGFVVPPAVVAELGFDSRTAILATVDGHRFPTSIGLRDGWYWMPVHERAVVGASFGRTMEIFVEPLPTCVVYRAVTTSRACRPGTPGRRGYPRRRRP
jgi:hypothetical protein